VDHQRQQQQQMVEQQMQLMHMMQMQQQAHVGSLGSSQSTFGSSASLFGGPSPLLGPRTSPCVGSFEGDSLQLGPNALGHMAGSTQPQLGLSGILPAGIGGLGLAAGQPSSCCPASGLLACNAALPELPCGAEQSCEQPRLLAADCRTANEGCASCFDGSGPTVLSSSMACQYPGTGMHAGSVLGGLHLPGSGASCWAAGPNELANSPMLFCAAPPSAACFGITGSGGAADLAHAPANAPSQGVPGLVTSNSQATDGLPPAWRQAQHGAEQQLQQEMLMMMHAVQQGRPMQHQHQHQLALPISVYSGQSLGQPGRVSIW
jgi:hypothetical protein